MKKAFFLLWVLVPLQALAGPGLWNYYVLPASSAGGQMGTYFRTDVYLVNPYPWKNVTVRMWFLKTSQDNSNAPSRDILIPAGGSVTLPDVVLNTFGTSGGGAVILDSSSTSSSAFFIASARTYTGSAGGTYGLFADGIYYLNGAGTESLISGVRNGNGFRTNTIVVSTNTTALSLQVSAYDSNGYPRGSRSVNLPPFGHQQLAVADFASSFDTGYLVWNCSTTTGSIGWAAYATAIDNTSGDSSFLPDRRDDVYAKYQNSFDLSGRWRGIGVLGSGIAGTVNALVYQNGPYLQLYLYDASTGERIVYLSGYESQGTVRLSGSGTNYQCLSNTATALFLVSASQISGGVSGTGCFSVGGTVNLTKQSSFVTAGEARMTATPPESSHGLGVGMTPRQAE